MLPPPIPACMPPRTIQSLYRSEDDISFALWRRFHYIVSTGTGSASYPCRTVRPRRPNAEESHDPRRPTPEEPYDPIILSHWPHAPPTRIVHLPNELLIAIIEIAFSQLHSIILNTSSRILRLAGEQRVSFERARNACRDLRVYDCDLHRTMMKAHGPEYARHITAPVHLLRVSRLFLIEGQRILYGKNIVFRCVERHPQCPGSSLSWLDKVSLFAMREIRCMEFPISILRLPYRDCLNRFLKQARLKKLVVDSIERGVDTSKLPTRWGISSWTSEALNDLGPFLLLMTRGNLKELVLQTVNTSYRQDEEDPPEACVEEMKKILGELDIVGEIFIDFVSEDCVTFRVAEVVPVPDGPTQDVVSELDMMALTSSFEELNIDHSATTSPRETLRPPTPYL